MSMTFRSLAPRALPLVAVAVVAACGEAFVTGGAPTTTGAGGASTSTTGAGGATSTGAGGATTSTSTGTAGTTITGSGGSGGSGGSTVTGAGGAGGATDAGVGGAGGVIASDAGPVDAGSIDAGAADAATDGGLLTCGPCQDTGEVCDPLQGTCVQAGWVRLLRATPGTLCRYDQKWGLIDLPKAISAGPSAYFGVPPGNQRLLVVDAAACPWPVPGNAQARARTVVLAAGTFHTLVDHPQSPLLLDDEAVSNAGPTRVRYVDAMPSFVDAPLDFSQPPLQGVGAPHRLQSGGLLAIGSGKNGQGYDDLPDTHRPTTKNPVVLTTDVPRFHFPSQDLPMVGQRFTLIAHDAAGASRVLACQDGFVSAACELLVPAGKDVNGVCDPRTGQTAPWTCLPCGQAARGGTYACDGTVKFEYFNLYQQPACACRPGVPAWNHVVTDGSVACPSCATLCSSLGRGCAAKCSTVGNVCNTSGLAAFDVESWNGVQVCETKSADCSAGPKYCTNAYNGYCCCE